MPRRNAEIAEIFYRIGNYLELLEENPFRVRAYRRAALTLAFLEDDVAALAERHELRALPGIGKDLAAHIEEYLRTGHVARHDELAARVPEGMLSLLRLPGVGSRTARALLEQLGVDDVDGLERAARARRVRTLRGFGPKREAALLRAVERSRSGTGRVPYHAALLAARELMEELRTSRYVDRVELAGSLRRGLETVGDVDLVVASRRPAELTAELARLASVEEVLAAGPTRGTVRLRAGLQADVRVVDASHWGAAWMYFTGSKAHNIRVRTLALRRGYKLSEYGLFRARSDAPLAARTEEEVYEALGLPWIAPELREDDGEVEAALARRLPRLVEVRDLRGDLHCHTRWSDGTASLAEVVEAARRRGYAYIAVTDHSPALGIAHGLDPRRLREQRRAIERLQRDLAGDEDLRILAGCEVDIHADGALDLRDEVLEALDFVVASVHGAFEQPAATMTARLVRAVSNPHVDVLGHPTTRLLSGRPPVAMDLDAVLTAALQGHTALEVNAQPDRLDLGGALVRRAVAAGVKLVISTDEHRPRDFDHIGYGVVQARRGWATAADVLNTLPRDRFLAWIGRARPRPSREPTPRRRAPRGRSTSHGQGG